ncbi:MAG: hypothetical protein V1837_05700 [Candidatus Woesearchaeota archaeon]
MLVISMPFCFTSALAGSFLRVNSISGKDGIYTQSENAPKHGYRKYFDNLTIDVDAQIDNDADINRSQVQANSFWFNSCTGSGGAFNCKYYETGYRSGTVSYQVKLLNDSGKMMRSEAVYVTTDLLAPVVKSISVSPHLTNGVNITVDSVAEDYADVEGDTSKCSGIKKIEFFRDDFSGPLLKMIEPSDPSQCSISSNFKLSVTDISGLSRICCKVTDRFDQVSGAGCDSFTVDKLAPSIRSARLYRADNALLLQFVGSSAIQSFLIVNISGTDLFQSSIKADISGINGQSGNLSPISVSVVDDNTVVRFNLNVQLSQTKTPTIKVYGRDNAGNSIGPLSISLQQLTFDNQGPVVTAIRTNMGQLNGQWIVGHNATFIAEVQENAGNLVNHNIFLDLSGLDLGVQQADNCTGSYTCYWYNRLVSAPTGTEADVVVSLDSSDDLGNKADSAKSITVKVDTSPVQVRSIVINTVHGSLVVPGVNYTVKGDKLAVRANLSDASQVTASANFSRVISTDSRLQGACSLITGTIWECVWDSSPIDRSGPFKAPVYFTFKDFVNNKVTVSVMVSVQGIKNETNPNYWTSEVTCSPDKIDRQVTTLIEQRVFCDVHLVAGFSGADTLGISLDKGKCVSLANNSMDFISDISLFNDGPGSRDPFLKVTLKATAMKISQLKFTCPLTIMSKVSSGQNFFVVQNPEIENATVTVLFYNLPLGEFTSEAKQKIEDVKNSAFVKLSFISTLEKFMSFAKTMCSIIKTWNQIVYYGNMIGQALNIIAKTTTAAQPAATSWRFGVDFNDKIKTTWTGSVYKFCMMVSCDVTLWGSWYNGYIKSFSDLTSGSQHGSLINLGTWDFSNQKINLLDKYGFKSAPWPQSPKDSLVLSLATGCLPGIIDKLQQWRQIQCNYGVCLQQSTNQRIPLKVCEDQKSYLECKFIFGEIFQIIPFANTFKQLGNYIYTIFSDPFSMVFSITQLICTPLVTTNPQGHFLCVAQKFVAEFSKVIVDLSNTFNNIKNLFKPANDMCKELEKVTTQPAAKPKAAATTT